MIVNDWGVQTAAERERERERERKGAWRSSHEVRILNPEVSLVAPQKQPPPDQGEGSRDLYGTPSKPGRGPLGWVC